jgi:ribonuclease HI
MANSTRQKVVIYTDGGAIGNPGPGGYGAVLLYGGHSKEIKGAYRLTTNNRMELKAAIEALSTLKKACDVILHSDSQYLVNAMTKGWVERWQANGWMRNKKEPALNVDLWEQLLPLCEKHRVQFVWVRGHAGNPDNERCDELTHEAIDAGDFLIDEVYEKSINSKQ